MANARRYVGPIDDDKAISTKQYINTTVTTLASTSVTAGNGLTGGGQLTANVTVTMGTPSSITSSSTNSVTSTSHTHAITGFSLDGHTHTIANVTNLQTTLDEKAASSHTHSYLALAGGTMTGVLTAQNNTSYTTKQVRNITLSTADPSGGADGDVWIKYTA